MKQERGPIPLLILAEIMILVIVGILGVVESLKPKEASSIEIEESTENAIADLTPTEQAHTEEEEHTESGMAGEAAVEPETFSAEVEEKAASMTIEEKVAQLFIISPEALTSQDTVTIAGNGTRSAVGQYPIGGIVYSSINYQTDKQAEALLYGAEQISNERIGLYLWLLAAGDGEDGRRITAMSRNYDAKPLTGLLQTAEAVRTAETNETILVLARFPENQETIDENTFCVILSNAPAADITGREGIPCCFSKEAVGYLRNTLHYHGMIMTDILSAEAAASGYSAGEAAVQAVLAGADLIYQPADFKEAYQAVLDAVNSGEISAEQIDLAVKHILAQKLQIPAPIEPERDTAAGSRPNAGSTNPRGNNNTPSSGTANNTPNQGNPENPAGGNRPEENHGGNETPQENNSPDENNNNPPPEENNHGGDSNEGNEGNETNPGGGEDPGDGNDDPNPGEGDGSDDGNDDPDPGDGDGGDDDSENNGD